MPVGPYYSYGNVQIQTSSVDLDQIANFMYSLMLRNFATNGWTFIGDGGVRSLPGCVIASPSKPHTQDTDQDYVFHWVRDSAICIIEAGALEPPESSLLDDYVSFSSRTQANAISAGNTAGHACFKVNGDVRNWSVQNDGPALRIISFIVLWPQLNSNSQNLAKQVILKDLDYLLNVYKYPTVNLWEENSGMHFFTGAVQLRAFTELKAQAASLGITISRPGDLNNAIAWLSGRPDAFWTNVNGGYYQSTEGGSGRGGNIDSDVIMAAVYGKMQCMTDKMMSTAAVIRDTFVNLYPINTWDKSQGFGPVIGRYPEDEYDGDMTAPPNIGHPWAACTCPFAEYYYNVAIELINKPLQITMQNKLFFQQIGYSGALGSFGVGSPEQKQVIGLLGDAAEKMIRDVVYHSDHLELSEQFDRYNGFEKSVRNLTWSYASYLSAMRVRTAYLQAVGA